MSETIDDAAGEAFDKIAKLLELPYPGGPEIEKRAREFNFVDTRSYPRSMAHEDDFSFSGLKTAVLYDMVKQGAYDLASKKLLNHNDAFKNKVNFFSPAPRFCTDNGAMIAFVGHYKAQQEKFSDFNLDIL